MTSNPSIFSRAGVLQTALSDHQPIYGVIPRLKYPQRHRVISTRHWNKDHLDSFQSDIKKIPWEQLKTAEDINQKLDIWTQHFTSILDKHFPTRRKRIRQKTHPWLDSNILSLMRRRDHVHKRAKQSGDNESWTLYRHLRNQVTSNLRKQRRNYFKQHLLEYKGNPKLFWRALKLVLPGKRKSTNIDKLVVDDKTFTEPKHIANALNHYFTGIAESVLSEAYSEQVSTASSSSTTASSSICESQSDAFPKFKPVSFEDVYKSLSM